VVHQCQRLALRLKSGYDALGVHAQLDDLERNAPTNRLFLFRHVDNPAAAFTNLLEQFVTADPITGFRCRLDGRTGDFSGAGRRGGRSGEKITSLFAGSKQFFDALAERDVPGASFVQIGTPRRARHLPGSAKDGQLAIRRINHAQFVSLSAFQSEKRA
jgi:hypothetical protein